MTTHTIIFLGLFDLNYGRFQQGPAAADKRAGLSALYIRHFGYPQ